MKYKPHIFPDEFVESVINLHIPPKLKSGSDSLQYHDRCVYIQGLAKASFAPLLRKSSMPFLRQILWIGLVLDPAAEKLAFPVRPLFSTQASTVLRFPLPAGVFSLMKMQTAESLGIPHRDNEEISNRNMGGIFIPLKDLPLSRLVQTAKKLDKRGLSRTIHPHDRRDSPSRSVREHL